MTAGLMTRRADRTARAGADATTLLTAYIVLLWLIPSVLVIPALGSAGSPSNLLGIGCFFWWAWFQVQRSEAPGVGFQPVRSAVLGWLLIMLTVYAHAMARPILVDEISVADNGVLRLLGMTGVLLLANDGVSDLHRMRVLAQRLALAAGAVAVLGLVQYVTATLWVDRLTIPGLTSNNTWVLSERSGFVRPSGTSTHPIEYGVVLAMALPVVVARAAGQGRHRLLFRLLLLPMIVSVYFSVSRSAYICAIAGLLVLAMSWSGRRRAAAAVVMLGASVAMYLFVPGLLGAIAGLFSRAAGDPSVASRTGSYQVAWEFISSSPLLGRGFGTFLPRYWILDNGYLGMLIEAGVLGVLGLLTVIGCGVSAGRRAELAADDPDDAQLARALMASVVAGACGLAFFDSFAFPQTAGCLFLLIGMAGAMHRLTRAPEPLPSTSRAGSSGA